MVRYLTLISGGIDDLAEKLLEERRALIIRYCTLTSHHSCYTSPQKASLALDRSQRHVSLHVLHPGNLASSQLPSLCAGAGPVAHANMKKRHGGCEGRNGNLFCFSIRKVFWPVVGRCSADEPLWWTLLVSASHPLSWSDSDFITTRHQAGQGLIDNGVRSSHRQR